MNQIMLFHGESIIWIDHSEFTYLANTEDSLKATKVTIRKKKGFEFEWKHLKKASTFSIQPTSSDHCVSYEYTI